MAGLQNAGSHQICLSGDCIPLHLLRRTKVCCCVRHQTCTGLCICSKAPANCNPLLLLDRMYVNIEDWVSRQTGQPNEPFLVSRWQRCSQRRRTVVRSHVLSMRPVRSVQQVVELFKSSCDARFHWGKAGWSTFWPCFDGAVIYPDTWCQFGCAVEVSSPHRLLFCFSGCC